MNPWPTSPLEDLVRDQQISYGVVQPGQDTPQGVPLVRVRDVRNGIVDTSNPMRVDHEIAARHTRTTLDGGELLLSLVGTVGESAVAPASIKGWNVARAIAVLRPEDVSSRWLQLCFESPGVQAIVDSLLNTTVQATLNLSDLKRIHIPVPPAAVREGIEQVLGALDDKIAANTKLGHAVEAFGSAKFTRLGLDVEPTGEGILLDDLFLLNPRRTVSSDRPTIIDMKALPTASPLVEEWTTGSRKGGARFKNGDTLVARITPCLENRKTAFVDFLDDEEVGIGSTEFIIMRSKNDLPLGLSYFMAISDRFRDFAIQNLVGTSGRQRVAAADLARHTLSPVDVSELQEFGKWADENLKFLGSLRDENRTLAEIRDALLPQLMSGKLHVKDAEKIVEDTI